MLTMWPSLPNFEIAAVERVGTEYIVTATATATAEWQACPKCGEESKTVHSWYEREPNDLPSIGNVVRLSLKVRRFFCKNVVCQRKIFCERVPEVVGWYARRTGRLAHSLTDTALELGGKAGARLARKLGMATSRDTLLRLVRRSAEVAQTIPEVIGVDDWAFCKGQRYGTLICDHETGVVIDLLPDRDAKTIAEWLQAYPSVKIVTRDRANTYAAGVTAGAPEAIQIADRWHLANNLVDAIEKTVAKQSGYLLGSTLENETEKTPRRSDDDDIRQSTLREDELAARAATRARRQAQYEQILLLQHANLSPNHIASQVGLSTKTVYRWLAHGSFPERQPRATGPTLLNPYHAYLQQRWVEGCQNWTDLYHELQQRGYTGSYATVYNYGVQLRASVTTQNESDSSADDTLSQQTPVPLSIPRRRYSPRQVAFMFVQEKSALSLTRQTDLPTLLPMISHNNL